MKCEDCKFLRLDIKCTGGNAEKLPEKYGKYTCPCYRYPQGILRSPKEPACGEFKISIRRFVRKLFKKGKTNE